MDVCILLTRGGQHFWQKSRDYNEHHWEEVQKRLKAGKSDSISEKEGSIQLHSKSSRKLLIDLNFILMPVSANFQVPPFILIFHPTITHLNQSSDADEEWKGWNRLGDPVLHIEIRDWADLFVISPLSAHTLAKIAQGLCDDTLSCVARAWDFSHGIRPGKSMLLAPAMNTAMWDHPISQQQLVTIQGFWKGHPEDKFFSINANAANESQQFTLFGFKIIALQVKTLACGELGNGALAPVEDILEAIEDSILKFFSTSQA